MRTWSFARPAAFNPHSRSPVAKRPEAAERDGSNQVSSSVPATSAGFDFGQTPVYPRMIDMLNSVPAQVERDSPDMVDFVPEEVALQPAPSVVSNAQAIEASLPATIPAAAKIASVSPPSGGVVNLVEDIPTSNYMGVDLPTLEKTQLGKGLEGGQSTKKKGAKQPKYAVANAVLQDAIQQIDDEISDFVRALAASWPVKAMKPGKPAPPVDHVQRLCEELRKLLTTAKIGEARNAAQRYEDAGQQKEAARNALVPAARAWAAEEREHAAALRVKLGYDHGAPDPSTRTSYVREAGARKIHSRVAGAKDDPLQSWTSRFADAWMSEWGRMSTYRGHGVGALKGQGCSLDLWIATSQDERGFYRRADVARILLEVIALCGSLKLDWHMCYDDVSVCEYINKKSGARRITWVGTPGGTGYHGPLNLHVHLDLVPSATDWNAQ